MRREWGVAVHKLIYKIQIIYSNYIFKAVSDIINISKKQLLHAIGFL